MKRTSELVLGLMGGICGVLCAFIGGFASAVEVEGAGSVIGLGWGAVVLLILDIVGSDMVKSKAKVGGLMGIFRKEKVAASV